MVSFRERNDLAVCMRLILLLHMWQEAAGVPAGIMGKIPPTLPTHYATTKRAADRVHRPPVQSKALGESALVKMFVMKVPALLLLVLLFVVKADDAANM